MSNRRNNEECTSKIVQVTVPANTATLLAPANNKRVSIAFHLTPPATYYISNDQGVTNTNSGGLSAGMMPVLYPRFVYGTVVAQSWYVYSTTATIVGVIETLDCDYDKEQGG